MLAAEVLVEAPQGLPGPLDDLLDGEILARPLVLELHGRVEKALDPALGPEPGGVERARHGEVTPTQRIRIRALCRHFALHIRRAYPNLRETRDLTWGVTHGSSARTTIPNFPRARHGAGAQTAGSISMSMLAAPLSGTRGWRQTSTGNEAFTSE